MEVQLIISLWAHPRLKKASHVSIQPKKKKKRWIETNRRICIFLYQCIQSTLKSGKINLSMSFIYWRVVPESITHMLLHNNFSGILLRSIHLSHNTLYASNPNLYAYLVLLLYDWSLISPCETRLLVHTKLRGLVGTISRQNSQKYSQLNMDKEKKTKKKYFECQ